MIQVVGKALKLLSLLGEEPDRAVTVSEAARRTGLTAPTAVRLLKSLSGAGYAEQAGARQGYRLGGAVYALAARGRRRETLLAVAEAPLDRLARESGETTLLSVLRQGRRLVLLQCDGQQLVQVRQEEFRQVHDPYVTATGRLLLAFLPDAEWQAFLAEHGRLDAAVWPEAAGVRTLERERARIRREGLAFKAPPGVVGIAAPVRQEDRVVAAIGTYLPSFRFKGAHRARVLKGLRRTADEVSRALSEPFCVSRRGKEK